MPAPTPKAYDTPLYPMRLYVYNEEGRYGPPVIITSEAQLHSLGTKMLLRDAMARKVEIRITDPGDLLLFHAEGGVIKFDGRTVTP